MCGARSVRRNQGPATTAIGRCVEDRCTRGGYATARCADLTNLVAIGHAATDDVEVEVVDLVVHVPLRCCDAVRR